MKADCFTVTFLGSSEDKADFGTWAANFVLQTNFSVAVPNYRLTSQEPAKDLHLHHPAHAQDILQFLEFLTKWNGPQPPTKLYDSQRIYLIGHSCSAHMLTSIFLDSSSVTPSLTPSPSLLRTVQGIILSEGIYDLELLEKSFGNYREWFLIPTFGHDRPLSVFATTKYSLRESGAHIRWLVIHSRGDTLIDLPQSEAMYKHLCQLYASAGLLAEDFVSSSVDRLEGEHNDILTDSVYLGIVRNFVVA